MSKVVKLPTRCDKCGVTFRNESFATAFQQLKQHIMLVHSLRKNA